MFQHCAKKMKSTVYISLALLCGLCVTGNQRKAYSQNAASSAVKEIKKSVEPSVKAESNVKVTFDEKSPGVVIVETGGERIKIDTATKSVTHLDESASTPTVPTASASQEPPPVKVETATEETDEPGSEPYDYRLVNVPTPKRVPKHSINLYFTHRFSESVRPVRESGKDLLGLDSFAVSSFGLFYGVTDKLSISAYRSPLCQNGLCRTIELGANYHLLQEKLNSPLTLAAYASIEGDDNFSDHYTYNLQLQMARSVTKYVNLFFAPAIHINSNGQRRFNPRSENFFPPTPLASQFKLGRHTGSFGFGVNARIRPTVSLLFEYTPRVGFKLGRVEPIFDDKFNIVGFRNSSEAEIGFGIQKDIGRHSFSLTFSNTQTTTTSRYNSSNLVLEPKDFIIGFNLFRRMK